MGADARGFKPGFANEVLRGDRHSAENPPLDHYQVESTWIH